MKNQQVNFISPSELKVSEHYEKVYGKNEAIDPLLKETIQKEGIKEPLIITKANNIVSGVLRWRIAMDLSQNPQHQRKFQVVPVIYTESEDTSTEIIIHNQGRTKTYTQKLKEFKILKFRSMCVEAEALKDKIPNQAQGAFFKNKNDPRITRVGKFLRRTSLDEFPQFWNVITGEMSLVGTRPPTPDEVERYDVPQWQRLDVKPGMTGEWQVNGRSQVHNFEEVIQLDLRYQENWSLSYDLRLIFKTILILFQKNSGAF
jgi:lipopolysaccharide/colanic/teichoic acid biosynthesis glycosyltransferase